MQEEEIELWKTKRLIRKLAQLRGANGGTSVITLILPPGEQLAKVSAMLTNEYGTASNIKSRVNRLSVLSAITSAQQKLKLFNKVPPKGLVLLSGEVDTTTGSKRICLAFEPPRKTTTYLYMCDSVFHLESLMEGLEDRSRVGFVVLDGDGAYFAYVCGNQKEKIEYFEVDLPPKHGRGGQSKLRFERLAEIPRHNYLVKVGEKMKAHFLTDDKPNVTMIFIAGSAYMKDRLVTGNFIDPRLMAVVSMPVISVSYGGSNGLDEALIYSRERTGRSKLLEEETILLQFMQSIEKDNKRYCYGVTDTFTAMELGILETLIVAEECPTPVKDITVPDYARETKDYAELEGQIELIELLIIMCKVKNTKLHIVSRNTGLGSQFLKGFGGIGGLLRYDYDFTANSVDPDVEVEEDIC